MTAEDTLVLDVEIEMMVRQSDEEVPAGPSEDATVIEIPDITEYPEYDE